MSIIGTLRYHRVLSMLGDLSRLEGTQSFGTYYGVRSR